MFLSNEVKSQILANFNANGFVLIPDFFSKNEIETINSNLSRVFDEVLPNIPDHEVFYENKGNSSMIKQISSVDQHDLFFNDLLTSSNLIELSALLLKYFL